MKTDHGGQAVIVMLNYFERCYAILIFKKCRPKVREEITLIYLG